MAAPTDSARQGTNITTAATSHAINVGSPSAGTLLIVAVRFASAPGTVTFTGYSTLAGPDTSDAADDTSQLFYRWADGTEGSTDTLTTGNSVKLAAICWEVTGACNPSSSVPTVSTPATGTTSANTSNPDTATPAGPPRDTLYLAIGLGDGETSAYTAAPTNFVNLATANSGTTGNANTNVFIGGASRALTASSSENPGAFTHGAHTTGWTAWTVAIIQPTQFKTLTPATETGAAQAIDKDKTKAVTTTTESGAAQAQNVDKALSVTASAETSAAQALDFEIDQSQHVALGTLRGLWLANRESSVGDPGSPYILWNDLTQIDATGLHVKGLDFDGVDHYAALLVLPIGTHLTLTDGASDTQVWEVTAVTGHGDWVEFGVTSVSFVGGNIATDTFITLTSAGGPPAPEADSAQALVASKEKALTHATGTDAAQAFDVDKHTRLALVGQPDGGYYGGGWFGGYYYGGFGDPTRGSTERDDAAAVDVDKHVTPVAATEADAAQALVVVKTIYVTLVVATETDAAQALDADKRLGITLVAETGAARALDADKHVTTTAAGETGTAPPLEGEKRAGLTPATEASSAVGLMHVKTVALTAALETDAAVALSYFIEGGGVTISPATETNAAQALVAARAVNAAPATENDAAIALTFEMVAGPPSSPTLASTGPGRTRPTTRTGLLGALTRPGRTHAPTD